MKMIEVERFITMCRCALIMESDGRGRLANENVISSIEVLPADAAAEGFNDQGFTHIAWYPAEKPKGDLGL